MTNFLFDSQSTVLSIRNARLLGEAAAVSYGDPGSCEQWARAHGFDEEFDFFSSTGVARSDTQGFIAQNREVVVVAFRGTQPNVPIDWLTDFKASHETWGHPVGKVHKGFYEALRAVWANLSAARSFFPNAC